MKQTFPIKFLLFTFFLFGFSTSSFSQIQPESIELAKAISIEPTEIESSAIFKFQFETSMELTYKVLMKSELVLEETINKKNGAEVRKIDFSKLSSGSYILKFFQNGIELKEISFTKK